MQVDCDCVIRSANAIDDQRIKSVPVVAGKCGPRPLAVQDETGHSASSVVEVNGWSPGNLNGF